MDLSSVEHERVLETEVEPVATIDMDAWLSNLENEALYIHLAALNLSQHRLIESVYILRQTDVQIGVALKISSATVKMRRHRLLATLRNGLKASKPSRRL